MDSNDILSYTSTPMGSLVMKTAVEEDLYLDRFLEMPDGLGKMLYSRNTGSFLRGVMKRFSLPVTRTPELAFQVLRVAVGEVELPKLAAVISTELKLPNDKAQGMAKEVERDVFGPVLLELNEFLKKKQAPAGNKAKQAGAQNVVDLKTPRSNDQ